MTNATAWGTLCQRPTGKAQHSANVWLALPFASWDIPALFFAQLWIRLTQVLVLKTISREGWTKCQIDSCLASPFLYVVMHMSHDGSGWGVFTNKCVPNGVLGPMSGRFICSSPLLISVYGVGHVHVLSGADVFLNFFLTYALRQGLSTEPREQSNKSS